MHTPYSPPTTIEPPAQIRVTSILVLALMMGVASFAAVVWFLPQKSPTAPDPRFLLYALTAIGTIAIIAYVLLPLLAVGQAKRRWAGRSSDQDGALAIAGILQINTLMRAALIEGASLFGCVIRLITADTTGMVAPIVGVILLATLLPARSRFDRLARAAQEP